jgi:hypothetical protein
MTTNAWETVLCMLYIHILLTIQLQEGRIAALDMVRHLLRRLPVPLLDEHAHLFFLALAVRLVGDESHKCRAAAGAAISAQLPRLSSEVFQQLLDYVMRWFGMAAATTATTATAASDTDSALLQAVDTSPEANKRRGLHKTAAVCAGLFVQARPDLLRRGDALPALLRALSAALPLEVSKLRAAAVDASAADGDASSATAVGVTHPWECVYHAAVCLERVLAALPAACDALLLQSSVQPTSSSNRSSSSSSSSLAAAAAAAEPITALEGLCACLLYPHAWVRLACARAWGVYLSRRDPITLAPPGQRPVSKPAVGTAVGHGGEFLREKGGPFRLCKQTAAQLDRTGVDAQLLDQAVKNLVWVVRAMHANPELCYIAPAATTATATAASAAAAAATVSSGASSGKRAVVVARSGRNGQPKRQQNGTTATTTAASAAASTNGSATAIAADGDSSDEGSDDSDGAESASDVGSDNEEGDAPDACESSPATVEKAVGQEPLQQRDPLVWIFHRMSFMGRAKGDARRRAVFKWFAAMGAALPVPVVARFLPHMLTPLRRCALDAAANDIGGADEGDVVMTNNSSAAAVAGEAAAGVAPVADLAAEVRTSTYMIHLDCV